MTITYAAHVDRARELAALQHFDAAIHAYQAALHMEPRAAPIYVEAAFLCIRMGRYEPAVRAFAGALLQAPHNTDALRGRAQCLFVLGRIEEAIESYDALLALAPDMDYMVGERLHAQLHCCDWRDYDVRRREIAERVRGGHRADIPGCFLCHSDSPADQRRCAEIFAADMCAVGQAVPRPAPRPPSGRIRIAYISADFRSHATAHLAAGLFERHDRSRFETFALSFGPNDGSDTRKRLERAVDCFIDVGGCTDEEIAARVADLGIDIAVDVKGHTLGARPRIFAMRPASVQVSFLAYPGTMGIDYMDHLVADRQVIPTDERSHYTEQIIGCSKARQPPLAICGWKRCDAASNPIGWSLRRGTMAGSTFTSRVATSLLHAVGLGHLSVTSLDDYQRLSVRLAADARELRALKEHLGTARSASSLFDPAVYAQRLEAAYVEIYARNQRGEPPSSISISATGTVDREAL